MKGLVVIALLASTTCGESSPAAQSSPRVEPERPSYFAKKLECARLADVRRERDRERNSTLGTFLPAEQCYAPSIDTCIYEDNFIGRDGVVERNVIDLTTSHYFVSYASDRANPQDEAISHAHFVAERARLFSLCADNTKGKP